MHLPKIPKVWTSWPLGCSTCTYDCTIFLNQMGVPLLRAHSPALQLSSFSRDSTCSLRFINKLSLCLSCFRNLGGWSSLGFRFSLYKLQRIIVEWCLRQDEDRNEQSYALLQLVFVKVCWSQSPLARRILVLTSANETFRCPHKRKWWVDYKVVWVFSFRHLI